MHSPSLESNTSRLIRRYGTLSYREAYDLDKAFLDSCPDNPPVFYNVKTFEIYDGRDPLNHPDAISDDPRLETAYSPATLYLYRTSVDCRARKVRCLDDWYGIDTNRDWAVEPTAYTKLEISSPQYVPFIIPPYGNRHPEYKVVHGFNRGLLRYILFYLRPSWMTERHIADYQLSYLEGVDDPVRHFDGPFSGACHWLETFDNGVTEEPREMTEVMARCELLNAFGVSGARINVPLDEIKDDYIKAYTLALRLAIAFGTSRNDLSSFSRRDNPEYNLLHILSNGLLELEARSMNPAEASLAARETIQKNPYFAPFLLDDGSIRNFLEENPYTYSLIENPRPPISFHGRKGGDRPYGFRYMRHMPPYDATMTLAGLVTLKASASLGVERLHKRRDPAFMSDLEVIGRAMTSPPPKRKPPGRPAKKPKPTTWEEELHPAYKPFLERLKEHPHLYSGDGASLIKRCALLKSVLNGSVKRATIPDEHLRVLFDKDQKFPGSKKNGEIIDAIMNKVAHPSVTPPPLQIGDDLYRQREDWNLALWAWASQLRGKYLHRLFYSRVLFGADAFRYVLATVPMRVEIPPNFKPIDLHVSACSISVHSLQTVWQHLIYYGGIVEMLAKRARRRGGSGSVMHDEKYWEAVLTLRCKHQDVNPKTVNLSVPKRSMSRYMALRLEHLETLPSLWKNYWRWRKDCYTAAQYRINQLRVTKERPEFPIDIEAIIEAYCSDHGCQVRYVDGELVWPFGEPNMNDISSLKDLPRLTALAETEKHMRVTEPKLKAIIEERHKKFEGSAPFDVQAWLEKRTPALAATIKEETDNFFEAKKLIRRIKLAEIGDAPGVLAPATLDLTALPVILGAHKEKRKAQREGLGALVGELGPPDKLCADEGFILRAKAMYDTRPRIDTVNDLLRDNKRVHRTLISNECRGLLWAALDKPYGGSRDFLPDVFYVTHRGVGGQEELKPLPEVYLFAVAQQMRAKFNLPLYPNEVAGPKLQLLEEALAGLENDGHGQESDV